MVAKKVQYTTSPYVQWKDMYNVFYFNLAKCFMVTLIGRCTSYYAGEHNYTTYHLMHSSYKPSP